MCARLLIKEATGRRNQNNRHEKLYDIKCLCAAALPHTPGGPVIIVIKSAYNNNEHIFIATSIEQLLSLVLLYAGLSVAPARH